MRTTVVLPSDLLAQAVSLSGARTKTAAIELGLRELIRQNKIEALRKLRGRLNLEVNFQKSRKR